MGTGNSLREFARREDVVQKHPDYALAKALLETAKEDLLYLEEEKITQRNARRLIVAQYDILRSIVEALVAIDGFKTYSHEAYATYLREKYTPRMSFQFDRFRRLRNRINYYGKRVRVEEAQRTMEKMRLLAGELQQVLEERLK